MRIFLSLLFALSFVLPSFGQDIACIQVDPLDKVAQEQPLPAENAASADAAKGETVSFQFVVRSKTPIANLKIQANNLTFGNEQIKPSLQAFVGWVKAVRKDKTTIYPDPLLDIGTLDVSADSNQSVWISYKIPKDVPAGLYTADITLIGETDGKTFTLKKQASVKIYNVLLPEQTLWVTNWSFPEHLNKMNGGQPVEPYSETHWHLLKTLANTSREHGQNVYLISPLYLCNIKNTGKDYSFDFTNFDKTVELLIKEGGLKRIEGNTLGHAQGGYGKPIMFYYPDGKGGFQTLPLKDESLQNFLRQFLSALQKHLQDKNWDKMYMQHIADEPGGNFQDYIDAAKFVKSIVPEIKIFEALTQGQRYENLVNVYVPIIWDYPKNRDYYKKRQAAGDEVWFYVSCDDGGYANRFFSRQLLETRFQHWFNFRYAITGYLHWGLNWWGHISGDAPLYTDFHASLPPGDCFIVYPAKDKVYSSIRFAAMRDGIADYELLKLLAAKNPDAASDLAGKIIIEPKRYETSVAVFRQIRKQLLETLEK
jgi:hypothetical protein